MALVFLATGVHGVFPCFWTQLHFSCPDVWKYHNFLLQKNKMLEPCRVGDRARVWAQSSCLQFGFLTNKHHLGVFNILNYKVCLLLSSWWSLLPVLFMLFMAREDLVGVQCFPALVVLLGWLPTDIPYGVPGCCRWGINPGNWRCFPAVLCGFQALSRLPPERAFFPPLYSPFTLERANPKSSRPEHPCRCWSHPRGTGNVVNGWQSSRLGGSAGIWRGKELELVGKMLGNFIPCHFRHGSVTVLMIFSHALISVLLSFTPLLFHH